MTLTPTARLRARRRADGRPDLRRAGRPLLRGAGRHLAPRALLAVGLGRCWAGQLLGRATQPSPPPRASRAHSDGGARQVMVTIQGNSAETGAQLQGLSSWLRQKGIPEQSRRAPPRPSALHTAAQQPAQHSHTAQLWSTPPPRGCTVQTTCSLAGTALSPRPADHRQPIMDYFHSIWTAKHHVDPAVLMAEMPPAMSFGVVRRGESTLLYRLSHTTLHTNLHIIRKY